MTDQDLVDAVTALSPSVGPLVDRPAVEAWAATQGIDIGEDERRHLPLIEVADLGEAAARRRLAKFKNGYAGNSRVAWCLVGNLSQPVRARLREGGWRELRFDCARGRWH